MTDTLNPHYLKTSPPADDFLGNPFVNNINRTPIEPATILEDGTRPPGFVDPAEIKSFGEVATILASSVDGVMGGRYSHDLLAISLQRYLAHMESYAAVASEVRDPAILDIHAQMLSLLNRRFPVIKVIPQNPFCDDGRKLHTGSNEPFIAALPAAEVAPPVIMVYGDAKRGASTAAEQVKGEHAHIAPPARPTRKEHAPKTTLERAYEDLEKFSEVELQDKYLEYGERIQRLDQKGELSVETKEMRDEATIRRQVMADIAAHKIALEMNDSKLLARHPWALTTIDDVKLERQRLIKLRGRYAEDSDLQHQIDTALGDLRSAVMSIQKGEVVEPTPLNDNDDRNSHGSSTGSGSSDDSVVDRRLTISPPVRPKGAREDNQGVPKTIIKPNNGPPSVVDESPSLLSSDPIDSIDKAANRLAYLQSLEGHPNVGDMARRMAILSLETYMRSHLVPLVTTHRVLEKAAEGETRHVLPTVEQDGRTHTRARSFVGYLSRQFSVNRLIRGRSTRLAAAAGVVGLLFVGGTEIGEDLANRNEKTEIVGHATNAVPYAGSAQNSSGILRKFELQADKTP